jgi:DNA invertase Pin-like site-specific DNA recombinase
MRFSLKSCATGVAAATTEIRAALYTRVSTKDKGQETANQVNQLREFCKIQGWMIVREYEDHDSGSKADRTRFQGMMSDAAQRRFDVLVFWAVDSATDLVEKEQTLFLLTGHATSGEFR